MTAQIGQAHLVYSSIRQWHARAVPLSTVASHLGIPLDALTAFFVNNSIMHEDGTIMHPDTPERTMLILLISLVLSHERRITAFPKNVTYNLGATERVTTAANTGR
jgi:hypothetical protein